MSYLHDDDDDDVSVYTFRVKGIFLYFERIVPLAYYEVTHMFYSQHE